MNRPGTGERGAAAVEFAIMVPALGLIIALAIGGGRIWFARAGVEQIAATAGRAASLADDAHQANAAAQRIAALQATAGGLHCVGLTVAVDAGGFAAPIGEPSAVTVRVSCAVPLADLVVPGLPGELSIESTSRSVLDRYRRRG